MRICIFCRQRASTKEDVWPQWLTKRFPLSDASRMEAELGGRDLGSWANKKPRLLPVGCVCKECNNGWMSRLESEVKPVIEGIIDNRIKAVDTSAQARIAVWAVKTSMTLESVRPQGKRFYTSDQRRGLQMSAIPERTSVWIAKCVNQPNIYSVAKDLWTSRGQNEVHAYVTTMAFGSLAFQVVSLRSRMNLSKETAIIYNVSEGPWDEVLVQVWPIMPNPKQWPPSQGLNGELGLEVLTNRLSLMK
jgi:hypothetical protein